MLKNYLITLAPNGPALENDKTGDLLEWYKNPSNQLVLGEQVLPVKFHFDVAPQDLVNIFQRCTFAWYAGYRGATLRNSSLSSLIANRFIIFTHKTPVTPKSLISGEYSGALKIFPGDHKSFREYVQWVFDQLSAPDTREQECLAQMDSLFNEQLSTPAIINSHVRLIAEKSSKRLLLRYFRMWSGRIQVKLAKQKIEQATGICIPEQVNRNKSKIIHDTKPLTTTEVKLFQLFLDAPWTLQHVSSTGEMIIKNGIIFSTDYINKVAAAHAISHTPENRGQTGQVFFSIGPGNNPPTPEFLVANTVKMHAFKFDLDSMLKSDDAQWEGATISGHWYAYDSAQTHAPVVIGDTEISVTHRFSAEIYDAKKQIIIKNVKSYQRIVIEVKPVDEIFSLRDAKAVMALKFIQILRNCDAQTSEKVFNADYQLAENVEQVFNLFHSIFHPGVLEAQVPGFVDIEFGTYTVIGPQESVEKQEYVSAFDQDLLDSLFSPAHCLLELCDDGIDITKKSPNIRFVLSNTVIACLAKVDNLDDHLAKDTNRVSSIQLIPPVSFSPYFVALAFSSRKLMQKLREMLGDISLEYDPVYAAMLLDKLISNGIKANANDINQAIRMADDLDCALLSLVFAVSGLKHEELLLGACLINNQPEILESYLGSWPIEFKTQEALDYRDDELFTSAIQDIINIPYNMIVMTFPNVAVLTSNHKFIKLLVDRFGFDINSTQPVEFTGGLQENRSRGFTLLMLAEMAGLTETALFLKQELHADPNMTNAVGMTSQDYREIRQKSVDISSFPEYAARANFVCLQLQDVVGDEYFLVNMHNVFTSFMPSNYKGIPCISHAIDRSIDELTRDYLSLRLPAHLIEKLPDRLEIIHTKTVYGNCLFKYNLVMIKLDGISKEEIQALSINNNLFRHGDQFDGINGLSIVIWDALANNAPHDRVHQLFSQNVAMHDLRLQLWKSMDNEDLEAIAAIQQDGFNPDICLRYEIAHGTALTAWEYAIYFGKRTVANFLEHNGYECKINHFDVERILLPILMQEENRESLEAYIKSNPKKEAFIRARLI